MCVGTNTHVPDGMGLHGTHFKITSSLLCRSPHNYQVENENWNFLRTAAIPSPDPRHTAIKSAVFSTPKPKSSPMSRRFFRLPNDSFNWFQPPFEAILLVQPFYHDWSHLEQLFNPFRCNYDTRSPQPYRPGNAHSPITLRLSRMLTRASFILLTGMAIHGTLSQIQCARHLKQLSTFILIAIILLCVLSTHRVARREMSVKALRLSQIQLKRLRFLNVYLRKWTTISTFTSKLE